jgi:hypothetical protein
MTLFRSTAALVLALGATFATPALAQKKNARTRTEEI